MIEDKIAGAVLLWAGSAVFALLCGIVQGVLIPLAEHKDLLSPFATVGIPVAFGLVLLGGLIAAVVALVSGVRMLLSKD